MFDIIFINTGLSEKDRALIGLFANISPIVFCNMGNWISNNTKFSNDSIIFSLNLVGIGSCLFLLASSSIIHPLLQNTTMIIVAVILLCGGLSAYSSLALVELQKFGMASVLISAIFFYVANGINLMGNIIIDSFPNQISMGVLTITVCLCVVVAGSMGNSSLAYDEKMQAL